jgi:Mn2+/Fe2+ NRAMP family transporter
MLIGFVLIALIVFLLIGKPVSILVVVGALNGFILPIALTLILLGSLNKKIIGEYKHSKWLIAFGVVVVVATLYLSIATVMQL